jgi:hypothetical protein
MGKKGNGVGALLLSLRPEEAKTVLFRLVEADPRLRAKVDGLIRDLLAEVDAESVAFDVESGLDLIDLEDINDRAGEHDGDYTGPDEAAYDLIQDVVEPHLDDLQRRIQAGRVKEGVEVCEGILLGLYRAKNVAISWAPDAALELASEAVELLGPAKLPSGFVSKRVPRWVVALGKLLVR